MRLRGSHSCRTFQIKHRLGDKGAGHGAPVLGGQRSPLLLERREQNAWHDSLELIQEAGDDKLQRVWTPSTLELALITLFQSGLSPPLNDLTTLVLQEAHGSVFAIRSPEMLAQAIKKTLALTAAPSD